MKKAFFGLISAVPRVDIETFKNIDPITAADKKNWNQLDIKNFKNEDNLFLFKK